MTLNIFSDTDFCLACEKPLKHSNQSYCDDTCRAKDGASKYASGAQVSPSILASLPALLASHITLPTRGREHSEASASTSSTSRSEESSPLQSPSPLANAEHSMDENSPKEDAFMLPGPAYPAVNGIFGSQNTYTGTTPVKISASHKTQGFLPPNSSLKNEFGTPVQQPDSTLHYGRRPGQTNSVTSPLALFPVNVTGHHGRRRESQGAAQAGARPSPHALSPLIKPIRLVSDPMMNVKAAQKAPYSPLQEPKRQFAYGMHSPLISAANAQQRPASTSAVDFSHANGTPGKRTSLMMGSNDQRKSSRAEGSRNGSTSPKQQIVPENSGHSRVVDNSLISRRRSFPVQLMGSLRSQLMTPVAKANKNNTTESDTTSHSDSDDDGSSALMSSTELPPPVTRAHDERGRGRSRDRRMSQVIREESAHGGEGDEISESRRHLGIGSTDRNRTGRSASRRPRAGSSDEERVGGRRTSRAGGRDSRSRDREGSRGRQPSGTITGAPTHVGGSEITSISTVPPPNHHHGRLGYQARDLSTIVGSLQQDEESSPVRGRLAAEDQRNQRRSESGRLAGSGAGSIV